MATYKDLVGTAVRNNAGNLTTAEKGQVWFDSTNVDFKYLFPATSSAFRTATNLPYNVTGANGVGAQTAALIFGGEGSPGAEVNTTNSYNGTTFTTVNSLNEVMQIGLNFGTSTSAIASGGERTPPGVSAKTESWIGS